MINNQNIETDAYTKSTAILDHQSAVIEKIAAEHRSEHSDDREFLRAVHHYLCQQLDAVYDLNELQPASVTLRISKGSCSQRMAVLEAVARSAGIGTRVRGLFVQGRFWNKRFPWAALFIPRKILLAWPQFRLSGSWVNFDELHGAASDLAARDPLGFTNKTDTLFDAVIRTSVDFAGKTSRRKTKHNCDLSGFVQKDLGFFDSRDQLFSEYGSLHRTLLGHAFKICFSNVLINREMAVIENA